MAVKADSIDSLCDLAAKVKESGVLDILIALNSNNKPARTLWELTQIRRQALKKNNRNLGYPVIVVFSKIIPAYLAI